MDLKPSELRLVLLAIRAAIEHEAKALALCHAERRGDITVTIREREKQIARFEDLRQRICAQLSVRR